jgi:hypothetical protein
MDEWGPMPMNDAILAIQEVITLYGQLLDDLRMEEWGRLFTEDAVWAMPGFVFEGREAIIKGVRAMEPDRPGTVKHLAFSPVIRFDGKDRARAWTDLLFLTRDGFADPWTVAIAGRYCDELVRSDGGWRFSLRACDIAPDDLPAVAFERGPPLAAG